MPLVTVKSKFQVTLPAKLRRGMTLREGDLLEATLAKGGILLRPKAVIDRQAAARRIETILARPQSPAKRGARSDAALLDDVIADIAKARKQRRKSKG